MSRKRGITKVILSRNQISKGDYKWWRKESMDAAGMIDAWYDMKSNNIYLILPCIAAGHRRHDKIIEAVMLTELHEVLHRCFSDVGDDAGVEREHCGMMLIDSRLV